MFSVKENGHPSTRPLWLMFYIFATLGTFLQPAMSEPAIKAGTASKPGPAGVWTHGTVPKSSAFLNRQPVPVSKKFEKRIREQIKITLAKTKNSPGDDKLFSRLAQLYLLVNDESGALENWNKAISLNPKSAFCFEARGATRLRAHDIAGGVDDFGEAIKLGRDSAAVRISRATGYSELGRHDLAIADFKEAVKKDPKAAMPYAGLSREYQTLGQWKESIDALNEAVALSPWEGSLFAARAEAWLKLGHKKNYEIDSHRAMQLGWRKEKSK